MDLVRPCIKCGRIDRYKNGKCRPCQRAGVTRWIANNREKYLDSKRQYRINNIEAAISRDKEWKANNKGYSTTYSRNRYKTDPNFRLRLRLRTRINEVVNSRVKAGSAVRDLGCSVEELKQHLEKQFQSGMTWENQGQWHIDHIIPLSKFDLTDRGQFLKACHFSNLQPLWAKDNIAKGAKHGN